MKYKANILPAIAFIGFAVLIIIQPEPCKAGCTEGLLLCGRVIIPSLFPFTAGVLFILKSEILQCQRINRITFPLFGLDSLSFSVLLLSLVGGYPVGAKLLNSLTAEKRLSPEAAQKMLGFCVNAGPAFVISAVGGGILNSKKAGALLFAAHISATLLLCLISRPLKPRVICLAPSQKKPLSTADNFVLSVSEAAQSVLTICFFVIFFSSLNAYIEYLSAQFHQLKALLYITEVTGAVAHTGNIYAISFLLGFSGVSVLCQITALLKAFKISLARFLLFRTLHGALSALLVWTVARVFGIGVFAISSTGHTEAVLFNSGASVGLSMLIMIIILILSISGKKAVKP